MSKRKREGGKRERVTEGKGKIEGERGKDRGRERKRGLIDSPIAYHVHVLILTHAHTHTHSCVSN